MMLEKSIPMSAGRDATVSGKLPNAEVSLDKPRTPDDGGTVGVDVADISDIEAAEVMASLDTKLTTAVSSHEPVQQTGISPSDYRVAGDLTTFTPNPYAQLPVVSANPFEYLFCRQPLNCHGGCCRETIVCCSCKGIAIAMNKKQRTLQDARSQASISITGVLLEIS